ncbi:MAG: HD domain-containing protein [Egibacteraceae bacterium]
MRKTELEGLVNFFYEAGLLKRSKRTGWWLAGVKDPESIAEHSFRTAIIGYVLALMEGADPGRTVTFCIFHDTQETRTGDIPSVGKRYVSTAAHAAVTADQVRDFPERIGAAVRALVMEYEARESLEARCARDADELECLIQAREYEAQGHADVTPWITTSAEALQTTSAQHLAKVCKEVPPRQWWTPFAEAMNRQATTIQAALQQANETT